MDIYDRVITLSEEKIIPILESVGDELTPHDMNELLDAMSPIPLFHAEWIKAFVHFAKACSEVSALKGFMEYLKETDIVFYDFVELMKNMYVHEENRVIVDGSFIDSSKPMNKKYLEKLKATI